MNRLDRIREAAEKDKNLRFTSLLHHITEDLLRTAYITLNRTAAAGVDDVTWREYGKKLKDHLPALHERVQSGRYRAMPSKRIWIPKPDGRKRPIGIAVLEDKIVQQAVAMVLNQIFEVDFLGFSYGFRPKRNPHNALDAVWVGIEKRKVNWVLDADVKGFFDAISHEWLLKFLEHRIADQRLLRLCRKWLRAGVSEAGQWSKTDVGTPQGAVISPVLANLYLHHVLYLWATPGERQLVVMSSSSAMPMISSWGFSIAMKRICSCSSCKSGWQSLDWNCTKRKLVLLNSGVSQRQTAPSEEKENRKRLTFWGSRTSVPKPREEIDSQYDEKQSPNVCGQR